MTILGNKYKSASSNTIGKRGSFALVCFVNDGELAFRCCQIQYFFRHEVALDSHLDDNNNIHTFAYVKWYKKSDVALHNYQATNYMHICQNTFEADSSDSILPVAKLFAPAAMVINHLSNVNIAIQLPQKLIP